MCKRLSLKKILEQRFLPEVGTGLLPGRTHQQTVDLQAGVGTRQQSFTLVASVAGEEARVDGIHLECLGRLSLGRREGQREGEQEGQHGGGQRGGRAAGGVHGGEQLSG